MKYGKMTWERLATELGAAHEFVVELKGQVSTLKERHGLIREKQETARVLLDASNDTSLLLDCDGNVIAANARDLPDDDMERD